MKSKDPEGVVRMAGEYLELFFSEAGLNDNPMICDLREGLTPAQSVGLTRDELSVIYALGFQKLNAGDTALAQDLFLWLVMVDPLHAPNLYCLGVAFQMQGKLAEASDAFLRFLALDATNPVGYLRYGECKLSLDDPARAREAFELAEAECLNGHGDAITLAEARAKLAVSKELAK